MIHSIDADFLAIPLTNLADAAISKAMSLGASHVDVRIERTRTGLLALRDAKPETQSDETVIGIGVRVIVDGAWGFASSPELSNSVAAQLAEKAVAMAQISKPLSTEFVNLVSEPIYKNQQWVSAYEIDPFSVSESDRKGRIEELSLKLLSDKSVNHTNANTMFVKEQKFYADSY